MAEYIEREALLHEMKMDIRPPFAVVRDFPAADVVSRSAYNQVKWERDLAIQQLREDYSVGLGAKKSADAAPVVRCGECKNYDGEFRCKCFTFDQEGMPVFMRADDFCSYGERKEATHD